MGGRGASAGNAKNLKRKKAIIEVNKTATKTTTKTKKKLKEELSKLQDTGKSSIIKKYNLSLSDLRTLQEAINSKESEFIASNVYNILKDYGYNVRKKGVGFIVKNK